MILRADPGRWPRPRQPGDQRASEDSSAGFPQTRPPETAEGSRSVGEPENSSSSHKSDSPAWDQARARFDQRRERLGEIIDSWNPHSPAMRPKIQEYRGVLATLDTMAARFEKMPDRDRAAAGLDGVTQLADKRLDRVDSRRIADRRLATSRACDILSTEALARNSHPQEPSMQL